MDIFSLNILVSFLLSGAFICVALNWLKSSTWVKPGKRLPTFPGIPLIGSLFTMRKDAHKKFYQFSRDHGKIFQVKIGSFRAIVLNDLHMIQNWLRQPEFSGRPEFRHILERGDGMPRGIGFNTGSSWEQERSTAKQFVTNCMTLNISNTETIINTAINETMIQIEKNLNLATNYKKIISMGPFKTVFQLVTGHVLEEETPVFQKLLAKIMGSDNSHQFSRYFPFLFDLKKVVGSFLNVLKPGQQSRNFFIMMHRPNADQNSYINLYFQKHGQDSEETDEEKLKNLHVNILDLLHAGSVTISATLSWLCVYLANNPEKQENLHREIDETLGLFGQVTSAYRNCMPYTQAVIDETLRLSSCTPLSVFRSATDNINFNGYQVSKGTLVIPNLYAAHHDSSIWAEPETFLPERFISLNGKKDNSFVPFSTGQRKCIGQELAKLELFLYTARIFQKFSVHPVSGNKVSEDSYPGTVLFPKCEKLVFCSRQENLNSYKGKK